MLNKVTVSGVIEDNEIELTRNKSLYMAQAILVTQNSKKDQVRKVKITFYNDAAKSFVAKQNIYKTHLCIYYGELSYVESKDTTIVKINEPPTIISKI